MLASEDTKEERILLDGKQRQLYVTTTQIIRITT